MLFRKMLKPREQHALRFLKSALDRTGLMPSYDEIGSAIGLRSRSSVHRIVHDLAERGYITAPQGRRQAAQVLIDPDHPAATAEAIQIPGGAFTPAARFITRSAQDLASSRYGIERADTLVLELDTRATGGSLSVVEVEPQRYRLCRLLESPEGLHLEDPDALGSRPYDPAVHAIASRVVGLIRSL